MNSYLLDSHSFLWSIDEHEKLNWPVSEVISNRANTIYVSSVTFWEISIKIALGKLSLENYTPLELLKIAQGAMGLILLPLSAIEAATFCRLPLHGIKTRLTEC